MAFVSSYSQGIPTGTSVVQIPTVYDVGGNNNLNQIYSHVYLASSTATGTVSAFFDTRPSFTVQIAGQGGIAAAIPSNAKTISVTAGTASSYLHFGKMDE